MVPFHAAVMSQAQGAVVYESQGCSGIWLKSFRSANGPNVCSASREAGLQTCLQGKATCRHCDCQSTVQMVRQGLKQLPAGQAGNAECQESLMSTASEERAVCDRP